MIEVLDIGAGCYPHEEATRAIDINKNGCGKRGIERPVNLQEYRRAKATRLPYKDCFFDKVVSRWALGVRIHYIKAFTEAYRVLKPDGIIEITIRRDDNKYLGGAIVKLEDVGFVIKDITKQRSVWENVKEETVRYEFIIEASKEESGNGFGGKVY